MDEWIKIGEVKDFICTSDFNKRDDIVASLARNRDFTGTFTITYPQKYNNKTRKFYREFLFIDLLIVKFPKKKNRRWNRLKRKGILCKF